MTLDEMISLMNSDLMNEWMHMRFYLYHASAVVGLHCHEYKELFLKEASSEMGHVTEFSDAIIGLGGIPTSDSNEFPQFTNPKDIISQAVFIENQVVENYAKRIEQAQQLGGTNGAWLEIFYENQLEHSRTDLDHFRQILKGT